MIKSENSLQNSFRNIKYSGFSEAMMIRRLMDAIKRAKTPEITDLIDNENVEMNDRYKGLFISESAYDGNIEVIGKLITRGYDINSNEGRPLQFAVENKDVKTINFLLDNGANIALLDLQKQDSLREMITTDDRQVESSFIPSPSSIIARKEMGVQNYNPKPFSKSF